MDHSKKITLFSVSGMPIQGMVSSVDPAALQPGQWALIQNGRWSNVAFQTRGGSALWRATTGLASGTFVGELTDVNAGAYVAINTGADTRIFKFSAGTYSEATSGATRFGGTTSIVYFERFTLPDPGVFLSLLGPLFTYSYVVARDGTSAAPRVMNVGVGATTAFSVNVISRPSLDHASARPRSIGAFLVNGTMTHTNSSTSFVASSQTLTGVGTFLQLAFTTTSASGQTAATQFTNSIAFSTDPSNRPSQMQIIYGGTQIDWWDAVRVELSDNAGATWYVVHDPTITKPQTATVGERYTSALFDCSSVMTAVGMSNWISLPTSFVPTRIRFTYVSATSPAAAFNLPIYGIAFGGGVPFQTQFGVTFYNANTTVESPPAICTNELPPTLRDVGGTPIAGVRLSSGPAAKYRYSIFWQNHTAGLDALVYATISGGSSEFYIIDSPTNAQLTTAAGTVQGTTFNSITFGRWKMPSDLNEPIPAGGAMRLGGDRLYASRLVSDRITQVAFSEKGMPNRFASLFSVIRGQVRPDSPGVATFGDERIQWIEETTGNVYGGDSRIVWTDRGCYEMAGVDAAQLALPKAVGPYGTLAPWSVCRYGNSLIWLDQDRQIRVLGTTFENFSSRAVEDRLLDIPTNRIANVTAAAWRDRYYLAYTPSGGTTNTRCLVYDARTGGWSDDLIASDLTFAKLLTPLDGNESRLVGFHTTGLAFTYDGTATTDINVNLTTVQPTVRLRSLALSSGHFDQIRISDIGITADPITGATWTTRLIDKTDGSIAAGQISLNPTTPGAMVWRWNRGTTSANERVATQDVGVQVELEGASPGGSKIYSIVVTSEGETPNGADRI